MLLIFLAPTFLSAQVESPIHEYKFSLETSVDNPTAKQVLERFSLDDRIITYKYIETCECFKVSTNEALSFEDLETMIRPLNVHLKGKVMTSTGEVLIPETHNPEAEE